MKFLYETFPQLKSSGLVAERNGLSKEEISILFHKIKEGKLSEEDAVKTLEDESTEPILLKILNKIGIKNIPIHENDIISLFSKLHKDLGFPQIIEVQPLFPDVLVEDAKGNEKRIELELYASGFDHDPKGCDFIVCWENDLAKNLQKIFQK